MEFFELVEKRRSIRKFKERVVEDYKIMKILEASKSAPSAGNLQAYRIYVIKDKKLKNKVAEACYNQTFVSEAPVVLIFFANPEESSAYYGERGKFYSIQDATIAATFAMLAAHDLGLGTCWVGAFDNDQLKSVMHTSLEPVAVLPIGYPGESPPKRKRKKIEEICTFI